MKRNKFSLSHYKLLTMDMGELIPITWFEALPGDSIQHATSALIRVSPLLSPVMHPVRVRLHHWFVPLRLIWDDFEDFITGGPDGDDSTQVPYFYNTTINEGTLHDYLGIPPHAYGVNDWWSALPARAYNLIYNDHYRDQDLCSEVALSTASGVDATTSIAIQKVAWEKDYFTTARPWQQKGTGVTIPLGTTAPVVSSGDGIPQFDDTSGGSVRTLKMKSSTVSADWSAAGAHTNLDAVWSNPKLQADLSSATGIDIADLRLALSIQRYQEARAKYGSRYVEYLRYLGVRSSDARLQSAEYLGGGRQIIQFSEVLQTAEGVAPVASMKGHGIAALRSNRYRRFFEEHGIVMTLMSVVPKSIYSSAIHRGWNRDVKEDYFQRELQFIGEQEVPYREIQHNHTTPDDLFGYQARYDEYRYMPSSIAGEFRTSLNHWHYARIFGSDVALNNTFVEATPTKRVNASSGTDCLYVMANHSIQARRMLSRRAVSKTF